MFDAKGRSGSSTRIAAALCALSAALLQAPAAKAQQSCIWGLGDSMMFALAPELSVAQPGRKVINDGFGGQFPAAVAGRAGASTVNLVIADQRLAGGASPTPVLSAAPELLTNTSPLRPEASIQGWLQGVSGTLNWRRNGGYSFSRATPGPESRTANPARFVVDLGEKDNCLLVMWAGRNGAAVDAQKTLAGLTAVADLRRRRNAPFLILTVHNTSPEAKGSPAYDSIALVNAELAKRYPEQIVDIRRWLIENGLKSVGLEPNERSRTELSADMVPTQLLADGLHLNRDANRALARFVAGEIARKKL